MPRGETLAYLAGIVDGDGYFKVSRTYRTSRTVHPYYATTVGVSQLWPGEGVRIFAAAFGGFIEEDRKSTRLNSSHLVISYAVFCLKKRPASKPKYRTFCRRP